MHFLTAATASLYSKAAIQNSLMPSGATTATVAKRVLAIARTCTPTRRFASREGCHTDPLSGHLDFRSFPKNSIANTRAMMMVAPVTSEHTDRERGQPVRIVLFPNFLSRERWVGPGNSKCVLGSRDSKSCRNRGRASDGATVPKVKGQRRPLSSRRARPQRSLLV